MEELFSLQKLHSFLQGVNKFYYNFEKRSAVSTVVWQEGSTTITEYANIVKADLPILFVIPSLINKSYILDLSEDDSFVRHFSTLGYRVYLVNFDEPLDDELHMGFDDYKNRLIRALTEVGKNNKIITIGYCLGGLFSCAIHSSLNVNNLIGQILIATPWDFSHFKKMLGLSNALILESFIAIFSSLNKISPALVQWFFSAIDPYKIWHKFCQFSEKNDEEEIEKFILIEQWVNDGISLTKKFALEALSMLNNSFLNKDKFLAISQSTACLFIGGEKDKIVPPSSYDFICKSLKSEVLIKETGHIGLIIGRTAKKQIYPAIEEWLSQFLK